MRHLTDEITHAHTKFTLFTDRNPAATGVLVNLAVLNSFQLVQSEGMDMILGEVKSLYAEPVIVHAGQNFVP